MAAAAPLQIQSFRGRRCALAVPRHPGSAILRVDAGLNELEAMLRDLGADPLHYVLGRARLADVLPHFLPRPEPVAEDAPPIERVFAACVIGRPFDCSAAVLLSGGTEQEMHRLMAQLRYPAYSYAVEGALLAEIVLVDDWDREHVRRFPIG